MGKRISLKGRGANIFFGGDPEPFQPQPANSAPSDPFPPVRSPHPPEPANGTLVGDLADTRSPESETPPGEGYLVATDGPPERPLASPSVRTPVRVNRKITRYSFEFYQDQIEMLQGFSIEEKISGEKGSMSRMVREAIDSYIAKRNRTGE